MKTLLGLLISVFALDISFAMQCKTPEFDQLRTSSDAIFSGTVLSIQHDVTDSKANDFCWPWSPEKPECGAKVAKIKIDKIWKGTPDTETKVFSRDGCYCTGVYFNEGQKLLIFGKVQGDRQAQFNTDACTSFDTTSADYSTTIKKLGKPLKTQ